MIRIVLKNIKKIIISKPLNDKVLLGRWNTNKKPEQIEKMADWASEDHCGCCTSLIQKKMIKTT